MKARLIRIGNSRGVRLPKPIIEEAGLGDEIEFQVREGAVIIRSAARPREGWAEAARLLHERGDDQAFEDAAGTHFDRKEWRWR